MSSSYSVEVESVDFKFAAAHFVAYAGFREKLHGHNYTAKVRLDGQRLNQDGYVLDFGDVKKVTRAACRDLNERFLIPIRTDVVDISLDGEAINVAAAAVAADDTAGYTTQPWHKDYLHVKALVESASPPAVTYAAFRAAGAAGATEEGAAGRGAKRQKPNPSTEVGEDAGKSTRPAFHRGNVELVTADGSFFSIPRGDCKVLPLVHTTAEEFASYLWHTIFDQLTESIGTTDLRESKGLLSMEVVVCERSIQRAGFKKTL